MGVIVDTTHGRLAGREKDGVLRFAGIPYAAPPVGDLRFAPPAPHAGWTGERDATVFGSSAPQGAGTIEMLTGAGPAESDEDCLFLNVWTAGLDDARRPVMVWIHGGAFTGGSGGIPWYHGTRFVQNGDVVVVTINYRLGALGWLSVAGLPGGEGATDNAGLLDQIAALEWVRDNIAGFGGNPDDVTIFGESAGGMSVATLMGTPAASGLFHKAIPQSGAAHAVAALDAAQEVRDRLLAAAGVDDLAGLRAIDTATLIELQGTVGTAYARDMASRPGPPTPGLAFMPIVDGAVLPEPPIEAVRRGSAASVPLLTGTTREEWKLFGLMLRRVDGEQTLLRRLGRLVEDPRQFADLYRQAADDADHDDLWTAIMTDRIFRIPAIRLAEAQRTHQPDTTWMYQFDWPSTAFDGRLGACHALEIPFVFDCLNRSGTDLFTGPDAPQALADAMHRSWIAFARDGDPGHDDLPDWPVYDPDTRATMHFDAESRLQHDPGAEARAAWDGLL
jgi:para-nitrobenzyl esterase